MTDALKQCHDSLAAAQQELSQLKAAMETRAPIEQAKGILMALLKDCDADQAFDVLTTVSQNTHVKLAVVATQLRDSVATGSPLPEDFAAALPEARRPVDPVG